MPASNRSSRNDSSHTFSTPVTSRIEMEDGPDRRLSVSFFPASSWSTVLPLSIPIFLTPLIFGVLLFRLIFSGPHSLDPALLIPIGCFGIAGASGYWFWTRWLHTATVTVENGSIKFTETPLFATGNTTTIPCDALDDVQVEQTHGRNSKRVYALSLTKPLYQQKATGPRSDQREIWVAGGLTNKAEADWIADRILQSAEEQASPA